MASSFNRVILGNHNDLTGRKFGKWEVLFQAESDKRRNRRWVCRCECGHEQTIRGSELNAGKANSCRGCAHRTHGMSNTPTFRSWAKMIERCYDANCPAYPSYGGRGISVCDRWRHSFQNFLADMGLRPTSEHSIDRYPNNNGNYCPDNCRWATATEQGRNKRNNVLITRNGITLCVSEWSAKIGIDAATIQARLARGWDGASALDATRHTSKLTAEQAKFCIASFRSKSKTICELAIQFNVTYQAIHYIVHGRNWKEVHDGKLL